MSTRTVQPIQFFDDLIAIVPHSASREEYIGRPVTLAEFSPGRVRLYEVAETGELLAERADGSGDFIEGPEYP